ncbi:uncharacterized protein LOC121373710 [Gigantopelta aegis]|uniref:uncharacterized protein LOC121373710 n=1 Tax=Gigantopelta aegis TaxID=1735272 RepID=UPI001B88D92D|nr:uncharacterized protein LOC121373710 [Gigantopelta aegis]
MDDETLIAAVRSRPCIYEKSDKNHCNRDVIAAAWEDVAKEVGTCVTATECKSRWDSIRDYFLKKYREYRSSTSGQAASKKKNMAPLRLFNVFDTILLHRTNQWQSSRKRRRHRNIG